MGTTKDLERMLFDETAEPTALPFSLLENITQGFSDELVIGRGGFAVVYKGILPNGPVVAVKRLFSWYMYDKEFQQEAECLLKVKHKNIVRFIGYCADTKGSMEMFEGKYVLVDTVQRLLCFEYLPKGSLEHYINDASGGLEWSNRYTIIKGICEGLNYLHQNKILHLDLKPSNILMDEDMVPKIIDFGQSRFLEGEQTRFIATRMGGTMGYLAPELFASREITYRVDLYSLGTIIKEILSGEKGHEVAESILESWRNRLDISQWEQIQIQVCAEIAIECTEFDAAKRPVSIKHIIDRLIKTEREQVIPAHGPSELLVVHQFAHKELPQKSNMDLILDKAPTLGDEDIDTFQSQPDNTSQKAFYTPRRDIIDSSKV